MYGVVLWLMFEVIANVYVTNQRAGLYPSEADSVSIPHGQKIHPSQFPNQSHRGNSHRSSTQRGQPQRMASTTQAPCPQPGEAITAPAGF